MFKKLFLFFITTMLVNLTFAHTIRCPTVSEIKNHQFNHWLPLYKENEELAMPNDVAQFQKNVAHVFVAKWDPKYLESAHCFYEGTDPMVNKIVFAQDAWRPARSSPKWIWIIEDKLAECVSSDPEECYFTT